MAEEKSLSVLFDEIVATTANILSAEACVLFLKNNERNVLVEQAGEGYVSHLIGKAEYRLIPREQLVEQPKRREDRVGLTAWIAITGESFLARSNEELRAHPHWRGQYDADHYREDSSGKQCHSLIGVPLMVGDEVVGVLKVENKKLGNQYVPFAEQDRLVFETLALSIGIAVGTVREQRILREQAVTDAMYRISTSLVGNLGLAPLLDQIVATTANILSAEACVLFLKNNERNVLVEQAGEGYVSHLIGKAEYRLIPREQLVEQPKRREDRVGLTAWIAITGESFLARSNEELRAHPHWRGQYDADHYREDSSGKQCHSLIGVPLMVGDEVVGVLKVENKIEDNKYVPFDEREGHIFQILANTAAIAIQNTRSFEELQEVRSLVAVGLSTTQIAHKLKGPVFNILLEAGLLKEYVEALAAASPESQRWTKHIIQYAEQLDIDINRMSRIAKPLSPEMKLCRIAAIIRNNSIEDVYLATQFSEREIAVTIDIPSHLDSLEIRGDANLLGEAVRNLVNNALEAVRDRGRIVVELEKRKETLIIRIIDDGPGISNAIGIFTPFETTKAGGLGLGLFIAKQNIEAHQGTIRYQSEVGKTCFEIELPPQVVD